MGMINIFYTYLGNLAQKRSEKKIYSFNESKKRDRARFSKKIIWLKFEVFGQLFKFESSNFSD